MRFGSLFTGIGGFDLGLERAGWECAWQVEKDAACSRVLADKFPGVARLENVASVGAGNLSPVDLVCGGFPCQDLSVAGRRAGLAGERSGLWFEFHRILVELAPRWVLIENVPGLLSSAGGRDMAVIVSGLADLGYGWAYRVLDAQHFGVPQRRRRVFIVGHLGGRTDRAVEVLFESEGGGRDSAARRTTRPRTAGSPLAGTLNSGGNAGGFRTEPGEHLIAHTLRAEGFDASEDGTGRGTPLPTLRGFGHGWQGQHNDDITRAGMVRRLTPRECERLQGFPDDWTDNQPDSTRYRQLGNAVCVPVAEWIGRRIMENGR